MRIMESVALRSAFAPCFASFSRRSDLISVFPALGGALAPWKMNRPLCADSSANTLESVASVPSESRVGRPIRSPWVKFCGTRVPCANQGLKSPKSVSLRPPLAQGTSAQSAHTAPFLASTHGAISHPSHRHMPQKSLSASRVLVGACRSRSQGYGDTMSTTTSTSTVHLCDVGSSTSD